MSQPRTQAQGSHVLGMQKSRYCCNLQTQSPVSAHTAGTRSSHMLAGQFQHTAPWSGRAKQNNLVKEWAAPQTSQLPGHHL